MIAVDTSVLVAVALDEPEEDDFLRVLTRYDCIVGTPTRFESYLVLRREGRARPLMVLDHVLALPTLMTIAFEAEHEAVARSAFERYGKGRGHPAQLNFGDCMTYAIAKRASAPLLFKGRDFARTDLVAATTLP